MKYTIYMASVSTEYLREYGGVTLKRFLSLLILHLLECKVWHGITGCHLAWIRPILTRNVVSIKN